MKELKLKKYIFIILSLYSLTLVFQSCQPDAKPNFVWIISEDNSKHYMKLFDDAGIATPNIEAMARDGVVFTRAFSNAPVCSVARSTLESSCYGPRTGTQYHRKSVLVPMPDGVEMFPAYLRKAGYYTTNNSKEDYNYVKEEGVWDESSVKAHWKNRNPDQPFFHKESHAISHESRLHFTADLLETYTPVTDPDDVSLFPEHPDTELFRFTSAYYRDKILGVDSIVGRVIKELEAEGQLENTFIFYFGDHGGVLPGSKGYAYETGLHIPLVVRIPENFRHLVHLSPGSQSQGFVSFVDFGPTLLELAGLDLPEGIDGIPFLGKELSFQGLDQRDVAYGYADRFDEKYDFVRTVRKGRMKYIRNYQPFNFDGLQNNYRYKCLAFEQWRDMFLKGQLNEVQSGFFKAREPEALYDLDVDPYETNNLAGDPVYGEHLDEMRTLLKGWVKSMPDLSFYPENVLIKNAFENPVVFGQDHKMDIAGLVDLADLSLQTYGKARTRLAEALNSEDPMQLYWGLIVCSCFGQQANEFYKTARELSRHENLLVRTRAAEFLGLTRMNNPMPVLSQALEESRDPVEALLILNSMVLLRDGSPGYNLNLSKLSLDPLVAEDSQVQRRLEYLDPESSQP